MYIVCTELKKIILFFKFFAWMILRIEILNICKYLCYMEKMIYEIGNVFLAQMARIWKSLPKIEAPSQIINHFLINEHYMFRIPIIVFFVSCNHYLYIMVAQVRPKCGPNMAQKRPEFKILRPEINLWKFPLVGP